MKIFFLSIYIFFCEDENNQMKDIYHLVINNYWIFSRWKIPSEPTSSHCIPPEKIIFLRCFSVLCCGFNHDISVLSPFLRLFWLQ